jgi:hypothetical protein
MVINYGQIFGGNVFLESENQLAEGLVNRKKQYPMIAGVFYKDNIIFIPPNLWI